MTVGITSDVATISITVFVKTTAKTKNTLVYGKNSSLMLSKGKKKEDLYLFVIIATRLITFILTVLNIEICS